MKQILAFITLVLFLVSNPVAAQKVVLTMQQGHSNPVKTLKLNRSGDFLLTGSADNTIKLWDTKNGRLIRTFSGHSNFVEQVSFDPEEKWLLSASGDKTLKIWDVNTGVEVKTLRGHQGNVTAGLFHPTGKIVFSSSWDGSVKFYNALSGKEIISEQLLNGRLNDLALHPTGNILAAAGSDGIIRLLKTSNAGLIAELKGHSEAVTKICFSTNGKQLLSVSDDQSLKLWDIASGKSVQTYKKYNNRLSGCSFSTDGEFVISSSQDGKIVFWDKDSGKQIRDIHGGLAVTNVMGAKGVIYFASGNGAYARNSTDGNLLVAYEGQSRRVNEISVAPGGNLAVVAQKNKSLSIVDLRNGQVRKQLQAHTNSVEAAVFSPDGKYLVSSGKDGYARIWNVPDFTLRKEIQVSDQTVGSVAFRPDGKYFATGAHDFSVKYWETYSGRQMRSFTGFTGLVTQVAVSDDGTKLAGVSWDGTLKVWDVASKTLDPILDINTEQDELWAVAFSPNSKKVAVGGSNHKIKEYDIATKKLLKTYDGHTDYVSVLQYAPDGSLLFSGSWDNSVIIWNVQTATPVKQLVGHNNYVRTLALGAEGKKLYSGGSDSRILVWDIAKGKNILSMVVFPEQNNRVVYNPQGFFDGTEQGIKAGLHYVKGAQIIPMEALYEAYYQPDLWKTIMSGKTLDSPHIDINTKFKLPPTIVLKFESKENIHFQNGQYISKQVRIKVTVEATDQGGGIDEIRLYHNGKLFESSQRGFKPLPIMGEVKSKTFDVILSSGKNTLTATALNLDRTEAFPAELMVYHKGMEAKADLYVFSVGIDNYKNGMMNLNYAKADADYFTEQLQKGSSKIFKNVYVTTLSDADFVKDKFIETFDELATKVQPQDVFVFYYAGHGVMSEPSGKKKGEFYLIPYNITQLYGSDGVLDKKGISADVLMELSTRVKAQKQLLVLDACQSGGAVKAMASRGAAEQKAIVQLARSTGMVLLAASGSEQFATEVEALGHGVFTYAFVEGLSGMADGGSKDGKITVNEIKAYLDDRVPQLTEQHKGMAQYPTGFMKGMDFPLTIK